MHGQHPLHFSVDSSKTRNMPCTLHIRMFSVGHRAHRNYTFVIKILVIEVLSWEKLLHFYLSLQLIPVYVCSQGSDIYSQQLTRSWSWHSYSLLGGNVRFSLQTVVQPTPCCQPCWYSIPQTEPKLCKNCKKAWQSQDVSTPNQTTRPLTHVGGFLLLAI